MTPDGLVVVDKPSDWTSHDVVARLRRAAGTRRVGHAGTLDPLATGVLVVGLGWSTKLLTHVVGVDKDYDATIRLGEATVTDDSEGETVATADAGALTDAQVDDAVAALTGSITQVPSSVSAIKIDGRRSYSRVRGGEQVVLAGRPVRVDRFAVLDRRRHGRVLDLDVRVTVSSGTYVRALARDLGAALGVGGHLTALRRTRVGPFELARAAPLAELTGPAGLPAAAVQDPAAAARLLLPWVELDAASTALFRHGRRPDVGNRRELPEGLPLAVVDDEGRLLGLGEYDGRHLRPLAVVPA